MERLANTERIKILSALNWDYDVGVNDMLRVVDGTLLKIGPFDAQRILVRCLERLTWYRIVQLWGMDRLLVVYNDSLLKRLRSTELRSRYAFTFGVLQKEPVSASRWSPELRESMQHFLLSNRWYRTKPRLS